MILYTLPSCPKCKILKDLLDKGLKNYTIGDIKDLEEMDFKTVPILKVEDKYMDFSKAMKYLQYGAI